MSFPLPLQASHARAATMALVLATLLGGGVTVRAQGVPGVDPNKCLAGKNKCVAKKIAGLMKCRAKCQQSPTTCGQVQTDCETKVMAKFDGGTDPAKGCFAKLEAKDDPADPASVCTTTGDTADIESEVNGLVTSIVARLEGTPAPICSDGVVNVAGEQCDGSDLDGYTCASLGPMVGILACDGTCKFDTSACEACGGGGQSCCNGGTCDPGMACGAGACSSAVALFTTGNLVGSSLGNRATTTASCTAAKPVSLDCSGGIVALLSYSGGDTIANLPTNHGLPAGLPLAGPTGILMANNWADAMSAGVTPRVNSPLSAGVTPTATVVWTGATGSGGLDVNCTDWTTAGTGSNGAPSATNFGWLDATAGPISCVGARRVMCACW